MSVQKYIDFLYNKEQTHDEETRMIKQMSISETRKRMTSLEDNLSYEDTICVTNHGKEVFAILRWETYESIAETLEILSDPDGYEDLKAGIAQAEQGLLIDFEEFKKGFDV
jgi:prevent-host-death family protein